MTKQRILRIPIYLTLIALLTGFLIYANGYRFTLNQLVSDLDQSLHFGPSYIVHQQVYKDQAIVISQHDDWLVCRLIKRSVGFLWHDTGLSYRPVNLQDELSESSNSQIIAQYADTCNKLADETMILDQLYLDLDDNRTSFMNELTNNGLTLVETTRQTVVKDNQIMLVQQFGNGHTQVEFYVTKYGYRLMIEIKALDEVSDSASCQSALRAIASNKLKGWAISSKLMSAVLQQSLASSDWVEEDQTIRIEYSHQNKTLLILNKGNQ